MKKYVRELGPLDKAFLYADGRVPDRVPPSERGELASLVDVLRTEEREGPAYEGGGGISPREMKTVLLNAAQNPDHDCLTPMSVFAEVRRLLKDKSLYAFLQREPEGAYFDYAKIVAHLEEVLLERVNREFLDVTGLVRREQYVELFTRYVNETSRWLKGEKVLNRHTGKYEEPDTRFMESIEARFGDVGEDPRPFREKLVHRIGAYRIDHPDEALDYAEIFADLFDRIRQSYFEEHRTKLHQLRRLLVQRLSGEKADLEPADQQRVDEVMRRLGAEYGYREPCAVETLAFLESRLYDEET
jgi:predicted Ser/Thr protein kinase